MGGLDEDTHPVGLQHIHDRVGDLVGEPLLHLQPPGEEFLRLVYGRGGE